MTSAKNDARSLLAERFGEDVVPLDLESAPTDVGARARFVATMHALITWVMEHPNVPVPWSTGLNIHVPDVAALDRLAAELPGATRSADGRALILFAPFDSREFYTTISVHVHDQPCRGDE
jgi:hypothetical protein